MYRVAQKTFDSFQVSYHLKHTVSRKTCVSQQKQQIWGNFEIRHFEAFNHPLNITDYEF